MKPPPSRDSNNSTSAEPTQSRGFSRIFHRVFQRFLQFVDKYKYAPLGTAAAIAFTVFAGGGTLCTVIGIQGNSTVFLTLGVVSLVVFAGVHSALLYRTHARFEASSQAVPVFEVRRELDQILPQIDHDHAMTVQRIVNDYETELRRLTDELTRLTNRDIPGKPEPIWGGAFVMGSDDFGEDERPQHSILVSAFAIDKYPVTNRQFVDFISDPANKDWLPGPIYERYGIPYYLSDWDGLVPPTGKWDHPVVNVNWYAAVAFCNWRSQCDQGRTPVYTIVNDVEVHHDFSKDGWRLPTEAEWEKTARAGLANLRYPWEGHLSPALANYGKHHRGTTPVGQFPANAFGVFDMLGNVKEWCHDVYSGTIYAERAETDVSDPCGPDAGPFRAFRGGSWMDRPEWIHVSKRGRMYPQNVNPDFGFRCVRKP